MRMTWLGVLALLLLSVSSLSAQDSRLRQLFSRSSSNGTFAINHPNEVVVVAAPANNPIIAPAPLPAPVNNAPVNAAPVNAAPVNPAGAPWNRKIWPLSTSSGWESRRSSVIWVTQAL